MNDLLSKLAPDPRLPGAWQGVLPYDGRSVDLHIDPDGGDLSQTLAHARAVILRLSEIDAHAKAVAANELLGAYNDTWRHYERADGRGGFSSVSDPELSAEKFGNLLMLVSVGLLGSTHYDLSFKAGRLFAGHGILVSVSEAASGPTSHVQLIG